jgi:uncharacterized membrane protein
LSSRWAYGLAVAVATLAALAVGRHLPLPACVLTAFLLVPLPVFMRWQARVSQGRAEAVPRSGLYLRWPG